MLRISTKLNTVIGASLSETHTSVTALRMCVCIYACLLGPTTYRKFYMSVYFNITEIELGYLELIEMTEVEAHMASYSLFATDYQWQVAHRQYKF